MPQASNPNQRTYILNVIQVIKGREGWSSAQKEWGGKWEAGNRVKVG